VVDENISGTSNREPVAHTKMIVAGGQRRANIIGAKTAKSRQAIEKSAHNDTMTLRFRYVWQSICIRSIENGQTKTRAEGASRSKASKKLAHTYIQGQ